MTQKLRPYFTKEYELFYLWRPEPLENKIQLAGEYRVLEDMQKRSLLLFGVRAIRREVRA
ncbi:MAG TPA: hypothetical protein VEB18_04250 [Candidatus Paceibacterota bacterium]|nr:hypothetical protein [Candidatus Paceibacterota bacterium]